MPEAHLAAVCRMSRRVEDWSGGRGPWPWPTSRELEKQVKETLFTEDLQILLCVPMPLSP